MKTSLHFEAPSDLSVGTVQIQGEGQTIADWVATPDNRTFLQDDLKPGIYSCLISPAGVSPRSVVFEVHEGMANNVKLPSFSALSSSGSNTSFFDMESQQTVAEVPYPVSLKFLEQLDWQYQSERITDLLNDKILDSKPAQQINISKERKRISIGLSEEKQGRESFNMFRGKSKMEQFSGRLEIEIPTDLRRDLWAGHRVRLSAAIEHLRVERCFLPLYRGGTRITVAAPPFAPSDLELVIMPVDPKLRALLRALDAGTSAEVIAVRDDVLGKGDLADLLADQADPWAAILVGLLAIRFPEVFPPIDPTWVEKLVERAGWAFDAFVIRASQAITVARTSSVEAQDTQKLQDDAVADAVVFLSKAQVAGSPYYSYTNQLFAEMAVGIAQYLKESEARVDPATVSRFGRLYNRWHRELPLQRGAGLTFTWLARDLAVLKNDKLLVPKRDASGRLRQSHTSIIFEGQVSAGHIAIIGGGPNSFQQLPDDDTFLSTVVEPEYRLSEMPALGRTAGPDDDPNLGRFGGQPSHDGYHLTAAFEPTENRDWVTIILTLEAERSAKIGLGDFAWFILHPTFSPSAIKVTFRGNRAQLRLQAWGGFTVGVWLPKTGVELECNLAKIDAAPQIIKTR